MDTKKPCYLFFDLDGTTIFQGVFPKEHRDTMIAVQKAGHKLILNTGRSKGNYMHASIDMKDLVWDGMFFGGAHLFYRDDCFFRTCMSDEDALTWGNYFYRYSVPFAYEGEERRVFFSMNPLESADPDTVLTQNQSDFISALLYEISINPPTKYTVDPEYRLDFKDLPSNTQMIYMEKCGELYSKSLDKGTAIRCFCEKYGISLEQCVCFGDGVNDLGAFRECKTSVAMKNGSDLLKKVATYCAKSRYGVAEGILHYFGEEILLTKA